MLYKMHPSRPQVYLRLYNTQPDKAYQKEAIQEYTGPDAEVLELFLQKIKENKRVEYYPGTSKRTGNIKVEIKIPSLHYIDLYYETGEQNKGVCDKLTAGLLDFYKEDIQRCMDEIRCNRA